MSYTDEYFQQLLDKTRQTVTIFDVMRELGDWEGADATKQVKCTFHGADTKPSARVYKDSGVMHCYVCAKPKYDAIRYVMESTGVSFKEAVYQIRDWFKVEVKSAGENLISDVDSVLDEKEPEFDLPAMLREAEETLISKRDETSFGAYLLASNYFDQIEMAVREAQIPREQILGELNSFCERVRGGYYV